MKFERSKYPDLPGVYIMKDGGGTVIYVGKATSLRSRLSQYFGRVDNHKTQLLVSQIDSIDFLVTGSAKEALILESNLIKTYQPRYNMALKDGRHYSYLAITREAFPRLLLARRNYGGGFRLKNAAFYGPFVEGTKRAISAGYLRKLFKIRVCKKLPKKACLQYHIGNCDAPCCGNISEADYEKNVEALRSVLEGKGEARSVIGSLSSRMKDASLKQDFERAAVLRDQMTSLRIFFDRQRVEGARKVCEDFISFQRIGESLHVRVLRSTNGVIGKAEKYSMAIREQEEPEISFCMQYYSGPAPAEAEGSPGEPAEALEPHGHGAVGVEKAGRLSTQSELPSRIYSNMGEADISVLNSAFGTDAFRHPGREKMKVLEIASGSLAYGELDSSVIRLKESLKLAHNPIVIETFDISTLFGSESVGSMVQFVNGAPNKAGYRRFKIKETEGQDDFAMIKEVVSRRYSRLLKEGSPMPDLVLIDGGLGQLHAAIEGMGEAGVSLEIASLAKKEEEVYLPGRESPLGLPRSDSGLKLLQRCRDEAHRFAISYHRLRRRKEYKS